MTTPVPGWYPDPGGGKKKLFWNGFRWVSWRKGLWWKLSGLGYPVAQAATDPPPAPGWYYNEHGRSYMMYWDGAQWFDTRRKRGFTAFAFGIGLPLHDFALRTAIRGFFLSFLIMGGFLGAGAIVAGAIARYRASRGAVNEYDSPMSTIFTATGAMALGLIDIAIAVVAYHLWTHR